ncbi:MAG: membrane protein insertase YidC, partial [Bacteroidota bacterium]
VEAQAVPAVGDTNVGRFFTHLRSGTEKVLVVRTDLYTAEISTRGGLVRKWNLTRYKTWDGHPVPMVERASGGDFSILFATSDGRLVNTRHLFFASDFPPGRTVTLAGTDSLTVELRLPIPGGRSITKRLRFRNGLYSFAADLVFRNMRDVIPDREYQVLWERGVRFAEHNSVDEAGFAKAFAYSGGELAEFEAPEGDNPAPTDKTGATEWVAARNKYFAAALLPEEGRGRGYLLGGVRSALPDKGISESYSLAVKMPLGGALQDSGRLTVFLGPLDFDVLKSYGRGLDQMLSLGAAWIIRPISEYVMLPLFQFLRWIIPNFGVVIIVFSLIIKVVLHPLSRTSMRSMKRMQALQPMMEEIRKKHKDDPQKINQQVMNLYKEYGVNPASGCLPLLLQMPILFALYAVFSSAIELRQAPFVWWITDLSIPDVVTRLPFELPLFGIRAVSGLALLMGATMFIQQKMTVTDPRQQAMVWMMPLMMTLLFNNFPSGLNLYYFVFNLLSILQQFWINKQHGSEPLRKAEPRKNRGGIMGRITRELPKLK